MQVTIVGTGYVGLVTAIVFAKKGVHVNCVDIDQEKIDLINSGKLPIYEEGLQELFNEVRANGTFKATRNLYKSVEKSEIVFICVGTPSRNNGSVDLKFIKKVSAQIGKAISKTSDYKIIVVKSTVPPETTKYIVAPIIEKYSGKKTGVDFGLGMNPEFLREGKAVVDTLYPDRIVVGGLTEKETSKLADFYSGVYPGVDLIKTNTTTAEATKYAANAFFTLLISYANEWAKLTETFNDKADVMDVLNGVYLDKRICPITEEGKRIRPGLITYLVPGCGFGGSCFPKDTKALNYFAKTKSEPMQLVRDIIAINEKRAGDVVKLLEKNTGALTGKKIALLGLAFKPDTDDVRDSPALKIIELLKNKGAVVYAHDPIAGENAKKMNLGVKIVDSVEEVLKDAEGAIVVTAWKQYREIPEAVYKQLMKQAIVLDCRRILNPRAFTNLTYLGVGVSNGKK
ncbi:MAG: UDP-glucose/GDP-mannose dehydrogenase family protein [Candidatus Micrarchaeota archaeon]